MALASTTAKRPFAFTLKQLEAIKVIAGVATHVMLYGGSRSGKTFLHVRNIVLRALKAPGSHHCILRFRFNHLKASVILGTFPKVMKLCFPGIKYVLSKTDWYVTFPNLSELWFGGLDDKERTEKILGQEYSTMLFNEASQIPKAARDTALTRLAEMAETRMVVNGEEVTDGTLKPRAFYDCNPPNKNHWTYLEFIKKIDPETRKPLPNPDDFAWFKMNPLDNASNIAPNYLKLLNSLSARMRKRFLDGEFADATPNALFADETIDKWRVLDGKVPEFVRVVVGVDPSGSGDEANVDADAIGTVVGALGVDGNAYLLEDCTVKAGPATWGKNATNAYDRHEADVIVGETNYGGDMVRFVVQTAKPRVPSRKSQRLAVKHVRAEPFSSLYENGKIRHVGVFQELEDEITAFSTTGYTGPNSPNRADAWFWVLAELFPALVAPKKETKKVEREDGAQRMARMIMKKTPVPMEPGFRRVGAASCRVNMPKVVPAHMKNRMREITEVKTAPDKRGQGYATTLMHKICHEADQMGFPAPVDGHRRTRRERRAPGAGKPRRVVRDPLRVPDDPGEHQADGPDARRNPASGPEAASDRRRRSGASPPWLIHRRRPRRIAKRTRRSSRMPRSTSKWSPVPMGRTSPKASRT
jgi:hypothetical protein